MVQAFEGTNDNKISQTSNLKGKCERNAKLIVGETVEGRGL